MWSGFNSRYYYTSSAGNFLEFSFTVTQEESLYEQDSFNFFNDYFNYYDDISHLKGCEYVSLS